MPPKKFAVIGTGVAGLTAAHVLRRSAQVTVFEADSRPGGHAHSHDISLADGSPVTIDTGFIVHNDRTYPTLQRLFTELDVPTQETDMSMSISGTPGWEYAGGRGLRGIFADPRTVGNPAYLKMLGEVRGFHQAARTLLASADTGDAVSIGDWLEAQTYSENFRDHFMRPLIAAVWSCDPQDSMSYPARSLLTFLDHHGMLSVTGSPQWRTVTGGSHTYVERVLDPIQDVRLATAVTRLQRTATGVTVHDSTGGSTEFDAVVVATHPHQALTMQPDPDRLTREVLGALTYSRNTAVLHTDRSLLPRHRGARASWNYRVSADAGAGVLVTYDLTRLHRLPSPAGQRVMVTLNDSGRVDPTQVIDRMEYEHPLYTASALAAQHRLPELSGPVVAYAGAYHGWGFHEDGALSGLLAAQSLGGEWT
ncbi:NAD(P)/FAD-dependent oxidoreductase [Leekyejoonella antrihumi]|uniref:FAD-dependent oxidoreductase n=1 Tax=Leekyejoonella antrihumi TaxID=1660198 RepID=A0A563E1H8_9MICO|nr:FAD-dependent oxidoreductase [Leekyejoonella antrihumi]TWP36390.1 FAD-dependent oxidoreductase [Leekyejoonella antrihumi]